MYSKVLDHKTYAAVVAAGFDPEEPLDRLARKVVSFLAQETATALNAQAVDGGQGALEMPLRKIADLLGAKASPKRMGLAIRSLGLMTARKQDGYYVRWNKGQLEILRSYLGV